MKTAKLKRPQFPLDTGLDFLQHIWQLNHALERVSLQMERRLGVTAQQRLFLRCIGRYPGMTASQLATVLHLDPGTISAGVRRLTQKGLLTRRRDENDSRRVFLGLTARGAALDQPDPGTAEFAVTRLVKQLKGSEVETVKRVLSRLSDDLAKVAAYTAR